MFKYCLSYSYIMFLVVDYVLRRDTCPHTLFVIIIIIASFC